MQKAVIYARVSSTGDRQSTARQVADLKSYAATGGMDIAGTYEEHISGAVRNEDRAVLQECLEHCFSNDVDVLLMSELSRLGRNVDEVLANVRLCKEHGLNIYFQKENISLFMQDGSKNPFITIFISVLGTCAEIERENIRFRLASGRAKYVADGGKLGRTRGSVKSAEKKAHEYRALIRELRRGTSLRKAAKICDVSLSTAQRIKAEFCPQSSAVLTRC